MQKCIVFMTLKTVSSGDFCRLPITFANSLDPDPVRRSVSPDLDPQRLTL